MNDGVLFTMIRCTHDRRIRWIMMTSCEFYDESYESCHWQKFWQL